MRLLFTGLLAHLITYTATGIGGGIAGCTRPAEPALTAAGRTPTALSDDYDLPQIQEAGELIAVTLSGPDTYYEYRGQGFGLQFGLAAAFAHSAGVRLRMETARDTAELLRRLEQNEADVAALELPAGTMESATTLFCGAYTDSTDRTGNSGRRQWLVRRSSPLLAEALNRWFTPSIRAQLTTEMQHQPTESGSIRRRMRAPIQSRQKGIISPYDAHFIRHASVIGWDWRLLAAQCYQESGFDPQAVSWAGARGLMQLMPGTAAHLGLPIAKIDDPALNIQTAAHYLRELNSTFADVRSADERISFVLAAYNGGAGHVRDAMTLARQAGHNEGKWSNVAPFILLLGEPRYYNDPAVKYGYMRGQETFNYVKAIRQRWNQYRDCIRGATPGSIPAPAKRSLKNGSYRSQVVRPDSGTAAATNPQP